MGLIQRSALYRLMIGDAAPAGSIGDGGAVSVASPLPPSGAALSPDEPVLIAYATQTGVAEDLAVSVEELLQMAGLRTRMVEFYDLDLAALQSAHQALILASTTCDGDPPDMADPFHDAYMGQPAALGQLQYGLLALGDRSYSHFCGFGHTLNTWLEASGAHPLFAPVYVDDEEDAALEHWYASVDAFIAARAPARRQA